MANTPQAKKRIRRNTARAEVNGARVSRIRSFVKKVELAIAGGDKTAAAEALAEAADKAVDDTRHLVAHRGRASQVGERSANTPDPGIVAIATILQDWCKQCGIERTPTAPEVAKATA